MLILMCRHNDISKAWDKSIKSKSSKSTPTPFSHRDKIFENNMHIANGFSDYCIDILKVKLSYIGIFYTSHRKFTRLKTLISLLL